MKDYLSLIRIRSWVKNLIVFAPLFFSTRMEWHNLIINALPAFISFCLASGSIYIFNDLTDIPYDRTHPLKKLRPLAAGKISRAKASWLSVSLLLTSLVISWLTKPVVLWAIGSYVILNLLYSLFLKKFSLIDLFVISLGFIFRIMAGSLATGVVLSDWIILLTLLLSVLLILGKRRQDIQIGVEGIPLRPSLRGYSKNYIDLMMVLVAAAMVTTYIMYSISPELESRIQSNYFKLTSLWIILAVLRFFQLIFVFQKTENPIELFLKDPFLLITVLLWLLSCFFFLYL